MRVLRVLLKAELDDEWLTPKEIAVRAGIPAEAVGSRIRELRTEGFDIHRTRGAGPVTSKKSSIGSKRRLDSRRRSVR